MVSYWLLAARVKTLPVSLCPVILGLALSLSSPSYSNTISVLIVACVLCIQIGTNYANDYYDYKKGADRQDRIGPQRMSHSFIAPIHMMYGAYILFALAFVLGIPLILHGGLPILSIGILAIFFGLIYTAGPFALAYMGGAEIVSYLFFGPISVLGTYYLQTGTWYWELIMIGSALGLISSALLVINNTRDITSDKRANKRTLAVRYGRTFSYVEYILMLYTPIIILDYLTDDSTYQMILIITLVMLALQLSRRFGKASPEDLNRLLPLTSAYLIVFSIISVYLLV
jgi:1,4-dihydroxy-2-naphthoate octaprenyltransferase